ncbi:hypothetical protein SERLA73DRAFT_27888, partial [Serpula lacrymans var. lacrymans S7.3]
IFLSTTVPIPYHTSLLTGEAWVCELINGHPDQIRHNLGVSLEVFKLLLASLPQKGFTMSHNGVVLEEQLAIFLY